MQPAVEDGSFQLRVEIGVRFDVRLPRGNSAAAGKREPGSGGRKAGDTPVSLAEILSGSGAASASMGHGGQERLSFTSKVSFKI